MREYSIGTQLDIGPGMTRECRDWIAAAGMEMTLRKGALIYRQGEPAETVYLLRSGQAKSVLTNASGNACLLRLHLPSSLLGLTALASTAIRDAEAVAITDVSLVSVPRARFQGLLRARPELAAYVIQLLVDRMSDFHHRVGDFFAQNVEQRLASALLSLSRPDPEHEASGGRRPVHLTHNELANLLNARRPTVTSILNRFLVHRLIAKEGRKIVVLDPDRLARLLPRHE